MIGATVMSPMEDILGFNAQNFEMLSVEVLDHPGIPCSNHLPKNYHLYVVSNQSILRSAAYLCDWNHKRAIINCHRKDQI